jgi:GNAT superfamily N-acetyltransferase
MHPDYQGRGIAKQLVEKIAEKAAGDNSMMVLECTTYMSM